MTDLDALHACDHCGNVFNALISDTCPLCGTHWTNTEPPEGEN